MVKHHLISDRTFRYNRRVNIKDKLELNTIISKRDSDNKQLRTSLVVANNNVRNTLSSYNFIYKSYTDLYRLHFDLSDKYDNLFEHNTSLKEQITTLEDKLLRMKNDYDLLVDEFIELNEKSENKSLENSNKEIV